MSQAQIKKILTRFREVLSENMSEQELGDLIFADESDLYSEVELAYADKEPEERHARQVATS